MKKKNPKGRKSSFSFCPLYASTPTHRHGVLQALPEVIHRQRQAHREHQEAQRVSEQVGLEPSKRRGLHDSESGSGADPDGEQRGEGLGDVLERGALARDGEVAGGGGGGAAAAETALGLALCVLHYRLRNTLDVELINLMKGSIYYILFIFFVFFLFLNIFFI